jgi:hypothetical protein
MLSIEGEIVFSNGQRIKARSFPTQIDLAGLGR